MHYIDLLLHIHCFHQLCAHDSLQLSVTVVYFSEHEPVPFHSHLQAIPLPYKMMKTEVDFSPVQTRYLKDSLHLIYPYSAQEYT